MAATESKHIKLGTINRFRELPAILLILVFVLAAGCFIAAGIWFAIPREPAITVGYVDDFTWQSPTYVPLRNDLAIFLDRSEDKIIALDATSPTSRCRIRWFSDFGLFIDPCCGAKWNRSGFPVVGTSAAGKDLKVYQVEVTMDGKIEVYPWRSQRANASGGC